MFWGERDSGSLCGQIRVLVVGDSGVGKTSLVNLIIKGSISRPSQTIGCTVGVKHITYGNSSSSSNSLKGVIFVHDLSQRRTKTSLHKWAAEIAATGTFSAPSRSGGPGGLPVPYILIGNKSDISAKEGTQGSSGNLVDVARQWVEKRGLLPSSEELPLYESFPGSGGLVAAAKESRYDKEGLMKFFHMLIRRRYFSDDIPAPMWSVSPVQRDSQRIDDTLIDEDDHSYNSSRSSDPYKYNMLPPLPAQSSVTPPVSVPENYSFPRFSFSDSSETSAETRTKRSYLNL